jgi:hypothetical protein
MGQFQPPADPSTVWLRGLIEAMDEVAASAAKPSAADREALASRLELPAMPARLGRSSTRQTIVEGIRGSFLGSAR